MRHTRAPLSRNQVVRLGRPAVHRNDPVFRGRFGILPARGGSAHGSARWRITLHVLKGSGDVKTLSYRQRHLWR